MQKSVWMKGIVIGIIGLFIGTSVLPNGISSNSTNIIKKNYTNNNTSGISRVTGFTNLIKNPGFELQLNYWNNTHDTAHWSADSSVFHNGSYSAKGVEISTGDLGRLYQDVTNIVTVGKTYKIGGWIKTVNVQGPHGSVGWAAIDFDYVAASGWSQPNSDVKKVGRVTGTTDWSYFESDWFTLPPMPSSCKMLWFCFDFDNGQGTAYWDDVFLYENNPPNTPTITGQQNGKAGKEYSYSFVSTDPDGDNVSYYVDWGDGNTTKWIGPAFSGEKTVVPHTWTIEGNYTIRAKAKDIYGLESDWAMLTVMMPVSYIMPRLMFWDQLFQRFPHAFPILRQLLGY